jgi:hypothetical protein
MKIVMSLVGAAGAVALMVTACSSGTSRTGGAGSAATSPASSASSASSTVAADSTATGAAPSSPPLASSASSTTGTGVCTQAQLTATTGASDAGAGQQSVIVIFTNHSNVSCTVQGFPGAAGLDASGKQVQQAARLGGPGATLTVSAGQAVSATAYAADGPTSSDPDQSCAAFAGGLAVTPPNTTTTVSLTDKADHLADCGLKITPVALGTAGNPGGN